MAQAARRSGVEADRGGGGVGGGRAGCLRSVPGPRGGPGHPPAGGAGDAAAGEVVPCAEGVRGGGGGGVCFPGAGEGEGAMRRLAVVAVLVAQGVFAAAPPLWLRPLTAEEQKEIAAWQQRLERHVAAGEFAEAARLAGQIAAYREKRQGAWHWRVI